MPVSNLMIQRRRINELKALGYTDAEPMEYKSYTEFFFTTKEITAYNCEQLKAAGFRIDHMDGDRNGRIRKGLLALFLYRLGESGP